MTDSFWTKVLWSRFIKHFRKLTDEQIIKDIHESMDALEDNDASGDSFGAKMVAWANERRNEKAAVASRENGNLGGRPKKTTAGAPNGDAGDVSATACGNNYKGSARPVSTPTISTNGPRQAENAAAEATAPSYGGSAARISTDGDTRKDSRNITNSSNGESLESATSVENSYAQALDCLKDKASDQAASNTGNAQPVACRESGKFKRKYGEGNTANVQPSDGPEDGKFEVTTKKPNGGGADAANRKTAEDCKSATSAQPLRPWKEVVEKSLGMTGNDQKRTGGHSPLSQSPSSRPPVRSVDVLNLAYAGEFGNVKLTQEQYAQLGIKFGNQQKLNRAIDSLSCQIENGE